MIQIHSNAHLCSYLVYLVMIKLISLPLYFAPGYVNALFLVKTFVDPLEPSLANCMIVPAEPARKFSVTMRVSQSPNMGTFARLVETAPAVSRCTHTPTECQGRNETHLPPGSVSRVISSSSSETSERPDVPTGLARFSPDEMFAMIFLPATLATAKIRGSVAPSS